MGLFGDSRDDGRRAVQCASNWQRTRETAEISTQTAAIERGEAAVQAIHRTSVEVQTDPPAAPDTSLAEVADAEGLAQFLQRAEPSVVDALEGNLRTHAYDGYEVFWEERTEAVSCKHTLAHEALPEALEATALAWNCTGSVLAVGYGSSVHENWCTHKTMLCTWNIDRRTLSPSKADQAIELSSCVMSVAYHPELPALLVCGTFNGEILLFDGSKDSGLEMVASSGFDGTAHTEPVTKVEWVSEQHGSRRKHVRIASVSGDGKVLVHSVVAKAGKMRLELHQRYAVPTSSVPRRMRISKARINSAVGITAMSFSAKDQQSFAVGTEGGLLLKCALQPHADASFQSVSPVTFALQPHTGPVYGCHWSPYHRNLVLAGGTDASVHLYNVLQPKPILTLEPRTGYVFDVQWSPSRPLLFAVATSDGHVSFYDLKASRTTPTTVLDAQVQHGGVNCLAFNQTRPDLLASGNAAGRVHVWHLSHELSAQAPAEAALLDDLGSLGEL